MSNATLLSFKADTIEYFIAASKWACVVSGFDVNLQFQPVVACLTGSSHTETKNSLKLSRRNVPHFYKLAEWWWLALSQESPKASDYDTLCKLWHLLPGAQTETASQNISRALLRRVWAEMLFLPCPCKSLCLLFRLRTWGEIGCANENEFLQNPMTCKCHHKELHTCFFCYVLKLDESCWVWLIFLSALYCPLPGLWAALSLHERNNLKWRNTSMSPFPPRVIIQLIFFFHQWFPL